MAEGIKYGYGWGIAQVHGYTTVGHGGGINGFITVTWRVIEEDAVSIVLSNSDAGSNVGKAARNFWNSSWTPIRRSVPVTSRSTAKCRPILSDGCSQNRGQGLAESPDIKALLSGRAMEL